MHWRLEGYRKMPMLLKMGICTYEISPFLNQYIVPVLLKDVSDSFFNKTLETLLNIIFLNDLTNIQNFHFENTSGSSWIDTIDTFLKSIRYKKLQLEQSTDIEFLKIIDQECTQLSSISKKYNKFPLYNDLHYGTENDLSTWTMAVAILRKILTEEKLSLIREFSIAKKELLLFQNRDDMKAILEGYHTIADQQNSTFLLSTIHKKYYIHKNRNFLSKLCVKAEKDYRDMIIIVAKYEEHNIQQYEVISRISILNTLKSVIN